MHRQQQEDRLDGAWQQAEGHFGDRVQMPISSCPRMILYYWKQPKQRSKTLLGQLGSWISYKIGVSFYNFSNLTLGSWKETSQRSEKFSINFSMAFPNLIILLYTPNSYISIIKIAKTNGTIPKILHLPYKIGIANGFDLFSGPGKGWGILRTWCHHQHHINKLHLSLFILQLLTECSWAY